MLGLCLGLPLGFMYLFIKLFQLITNRHITRNRLLLILGAMGIALLAAQITPPKEWDLFQHYDEIERIRDWGATYAWEKSRYASYYGATALFYLTSLTPWNGTLPFLAVFLELSIYEKIISHYSEQIDAQSEGICFFLFLALSNIVLAISGIRNVLAVVLVNYAIWDYECAKKRYILIDAAIVLFAITIHPASGILVFIYALSYIPLLAVGAGIAILILPVLTNILNNFLSSQNAILSSSAGLFALYTREEAGLDIRVRIVSAILIIFSIIVLFRIIRFQKKKKRYLYFTLLYSLGTLGMISQGLIYSRMLYGFNILYPIIIANKNENVCDSSLNKTIYWYKLYCLFYCVGMLLFQGYELARAIIFG